MLKGHTIRGAALLLSVTAFPLCQPDLAYAFDTGPHHDMTRAAMRDEGFAPGSPVVGIAQVSNFLVDYFSVVEGTLSSTPNLAHLHFDNLATPAQVRNTWARLALNTQNSVRAAAAAVQSAPNSAERYRRLVYLAALIGASLHPVQDFYSHSNWAELYPMRGDVYGTRTWFDTPSPSLSLHTGRVGSDGSLAPTGDPARDHGGYDAGMNHDSYSRPNWAQAYVYGYSASRQWIRAIRQWVEGVQPALWQELLTFRLAPSDAKDLQSDLKSAYRVSLWTEGEGKDGAWKGRGSGDFAFYQEAAGRLIPPWSVIVAGFISTGGLTRDLEKRDADPGTAPGMPRVALGRRAVEVRTLRATMLESGVDFLGSADLYATLTINGQRFDESTQQDHEDIRPPWLSIAFVDIAQDVVPVRYALFDEDDGLNGDADPVDVHPAGGRRVAEFQFNTRSRALSGDLSGIHDGEQRPALLRGGGGDGDPASVVLYVTSHALEEPPAAPR